MSWKDHLVHLQDILERLQNAGQTVNLNKCRFGVEETDYLGHAVSNGMVTLCQNKTEAIKKFQVPETKKQERLFLGLAGYYWKFFKNLSDFAAPVKNFLRENLNR